MSLSRLALVSIALTGCEPTDLIVPLTDPSPPSALWVQADVPDQALANVVLDGVDLVAEVGDDDQIVITARGDDPDGGVQRLSLWSTQTRTRTGQTEGPSLTGKPDAEFLSAAGVGQPAGASETVSWTLDVDPLLNGWTDLYVDVWAEAENFHGGVSTSPTLTLHAQRLGLRLYVVALSDDDGGHAPQVTADQFADVVDRANVSFHGTGLTLDYDPATDFEVRPDTSMNDDSTIFGDANALADTLPGRLLVVLRWGSDPGGVTGNGNAYPPPGGGPTPPSVTDVDQRYVSLPSLYPTDDSFLKLHNGGFVAHEIGHYLGLYHTFPGWSGVGTVFPTSPADGTSADQDVLDWVAANGGTVDQALDGDLLADTAPDPGVELYLAHGTTPCEAPTMTLTGVDPSGAPTAVDVAPPYTNVMSYYARCGVSPGSFSPDQVARMHHVLTLPARSHLVTP